MFKLVGEDTFHIDQTRCIIRVDPAPGFKYEYSLYIDGKSHEQYTEDMTRQYRLWLYTCDSAAEPPPQEYRIMLKLDTLSLYVNDELRTEEVRHGHGWVPPPPHSLTYPSLRFITSVFAVGFRPRRHRHQVPAAGHGIRASGTLKWQ